MTKQKHACPINVVKQNQGTGNKELAILGEKTSAEIPGTLRGERHADL